MTWTQWPWLELTIAVPLLFAVATFFVRDQLRAVRLAGLGCAITFLLAMVAWIAHSLADVSGAGPLFRVDELTAPLVPLVAFMHLLTVVMTSADKARRFGTPRFLLSLFLRLALFSTFEQNLLIPLLVLCVVPPYFDLRSRGHRSRLYVIHMGVFVALLLVGWILTSSNLIQLGAACYLVAALVRSGVLPAHVWVPDLFANGSLSSALLSVGPLVGVYMAVRLAVPVAPGWMLAAVTVLSLLTAVCSAGLALVQNSVRRFVAHLFVSFSSLVFIGLEVHTRESCTGALALWFSLMLSATGVGLIVRALEDRYGLLPLKSFHGLYDRCPLLAVGFLVCGLACVGFPGTMGFVASELLIDGTIHENPWIGIAMILVSAMNGIAIMRVYWKLFCGRKPASQAELPITRTERWSVTLLCLIIVAGGLFPQPELNSRMKASSVLFVNPPVPEVATTHL